MSEDLQLHQVQYAGYTGILLCVFSTLTAVPAFFLFFWWAYIFDRNLLMSDVEVAALPGLALFFVLAILHEWCHGYAYRLTGKKVSYGFVWINLFFGLRAPAFYAVADGWVTRRQFALTGVAPTAIITALGLTLLTVIPILHYVLIVALICHTCGCVGDWYVLFRIARLPKNALFQDKKDGFEYRLPTSPFD